MKHYVATLFALFISVFMTDLAHAAFVSGTATGQWFVWNKNGNYCPSNNSCVGAFYPQSQYDSMQPIANAKVQILQASNGLVIGEGVTGDDGTFSINWVAITNPGTIKAVVYAAHRDNRFFIGDANGYLASNASGAATVSFPTTNIGGWYVGSSAGPNPWWNAYWAIEREWRLTLSLVGVEVNNFTAVEVRGFADSMPGFINAINDTCVTSCAWGPEKKVHLSADADRMPLSRAMHEIGHIASYVARPWDLNLNYAWPDATNASASGSHDFKTVEWGAVDFEEAIASHYANLTFWGDWSTTPTHCRTTGICYTATGAALADANIEATSYPFNTNNCVTNEGRWELSTMRFLWDVYDNHNDADGDSYTANNGDFWKHLAVLASYPAGTGANQINEPSTNRDGRGSAAYVVNYVNLSGATSISTLRVDNCSPP